MCSARTTRPTPAWKDAKFFYGAFSAMVGPGRGHRAHPRGAARSHHHGVQALAGVLLPSATVFLLLLCNDKAVLGPWVKPPLAQRAGHGDRFDPAHDVVHLDDHDRVHARERHDAGRGDGRDLVVTSASPASCSGASGEGPRRSRSRRSCAPPGACRPSTLVDRPTWSKSRLYAMYALRVYLVVAVLLLLVKAIQIG